MKGTVWLIVLGALALTAAGSTLWIASLPSEGAPAAAASPPISQQEHEATLVALRHRERPRPLIAVIGINDATETTDYVMRYGILRRSGVADVLALATEPGPIQLYPALKVEPDATIARFDAEHPDGADYVIVPAMSRQDDRVALEWIRAQADKGATVIGVCSGALILSAAGLLDDKRATTHWYSLGELRERTPSLRHVADRRFVVDGKVATTTGISASMPMTLALIEAIAGRAKAEEVGRDLGLSQWDARHDSGAFGFTRPFALTVARNALAFWDREQVDIELRAGMDEVSLALVADAWSRTYRSRARTYAMSADGARSRGGLRILPDEVRSNGQASALRPAIGEHPAAALASALHGIERRYGAPTARVVAMQLELPR